MLISIIFAILFFGLIILLHEFGHFIFAKIFRIDVTEFSIGMGPKIFSKNSKSGTLYSLRTLPVGGYVAMSGEDEENDAPNSFCNKSKTKRFIVLFAGAFMNIFLGFILMLFCVLFSQNIYSNKIESFLVKDTDGTIVEEFQGLRQGDEILEINNKKLFVRYDYVFSSMREGAEKCKLKIKRENEILIIDNFSFPTTTQNNTIFGNPNFFIPYEKEKNFASVISEAFFQTTTAVKMVYYSIFDILTGVHSPSEVSGPVGVVGQISKTSSQGILAVLFLFALITINIGVFNLLPFPALDGGRILFLFIEFVIRRPINKKVENYINALGLAILFLLMIIITFKDIYTLF